MTPQVSSRMTHWVAPRTRPTCSAVRPVRRSLFAELDMAPRESPYYQHNGGLSTSATEGLTWCASHPHPHPSHRTASPPPIQRKSTPTQAHVRGELRMLLLGRVAGTAPPENAHIPSWAKSLASLRPLGPGSGKPRSRTLSERAAA
eukprot:scaffold26143_cov60-Phaeocystis_antarctica.AAC.5